MEYLKNLQFIFMPQYWLMNNPYNKAVDEVINDLLDKYEFSNLSDSGYTAKLGNATIWVENIPYAFGTLYDTKFSHLRPSRLTIKRMLEKFIAFKKQHDAGIYEEIKKEYNLL